MDSFTSIEEDTIDILSKLFEEGGLMRGERLQSQNSQTVRASVILSPATPNVVTQMELEM